MLVSSRVRDINESITLKLNARAMELSESGKNIYNLTAGQLPFRPMNEFVEQIKNELNFLKSFQYSPVAGFKDLRTKVMKYIEKTRNIDLGVLGDKFDCIISNGGKHSLANALWSLVDPGDEVIVLAPYWVSYPQLIKFCRGVPIIVNSGLFETFSPSIDEIRKAISDKTKMIIVNSPNNPAGIHYSKDWMKDFGLLLKENPQICVISDEIYFELSYFDPGPTYFYQYYPELLERTIIIDGISKALASTGLRIGFGIAPTNIADAMAKLQGQTTSGANSLIQRALAQVDFDLIPSFVTPIRGHLRHNAQIVQDYLRNAGLAKSWYQSTSAFYFLLDFSNTPLMNNYREDAHDRSDYSHQISEDLLNKHSIAVVPGADFGAPNCARISLVMESGPLKESFERIVNFMKTTPVSH